MFCTPSPDALFPDGSLLIMAGLRRVVVPGGVLPPGAADFALRVSRTGDYRSSPGFPANGTPRECLTTFRNDSGQDLTGTRYFCKLPDGTFSPDGRLLVNLLVPPGRQAGDTSAVRVVALGETGDTLFDRIVSYDAVPTTRQDVDRKVARALATAEANTTAAEWKRIKAALTAQQKASASGPMTRFQPPVGLIVGDDRSIWLGLPITDSTQRWMVLDSTGTPRGVAVLPPGAELMSASLTSIWTWTQKPDTLVRYRVSGVP